MNKNQLYKEIKRRILENEISPGKWILEREIVEEFGISRTPVKEILRILYSDGLIMFEPAKGYQVRILRLDEVVQIY